MEKEKATPSEKKAAVETIRSKFKGAASKAQGARLPEALTRFLIATFEGMRRLAELLWATGAGHEQKLQAQ